jgi:hypothetical protein
VARPRPVPPLALVSELRRQPSGDGTSDKVSLGEITSHRAVTTVNANVASMGFQDFGNFHSRYPAIRTTGLLTLALAGISPAEHTSVYWSQHPDLRLSPHPAEND